MKGKNQMNHARLNGIVALAATYPSSTYHLTELYKPGNIATLELREKTKKQKQFGTQLGQRILQPYCPESFLETS